MSITSATTRKSVTMTEAFLAGALFGALGVLAILAVAP